MKFSLQQRRRFCSFEPLEGAAGTVSRDQIDATILFLSLPEKSWKLFSISYKFKSTLFSFLTQKILNEITASKPYRQSYGTTKEV